MVSHPAYVEGFHAQYKKINKQDHDNPNAKQTFQNKTSTSILVEILHKMFEDYANRAYIANGFSLGFGIGFQGEECVTVSDNISVWLYSWNKALDKSKSV